MNEMNQLYPIIRRVRRPLVQRASVTPAPVVVEAPAVEPAPPAKPAEPSADEPRDGDTASLY